MSEIIAEPTFMKTKTMNWCLACSPDGTKVASGGADRAIQIWDLETACLVGLLEGHLNDVFSVDYSPNGEEIVSGSSDRTVRIWSSSTMKQIQVLDARGWVNTVQYAPSGLFFASAGYDQLIKIWSSTGELVSELEGHTSPICSIKYKSETVLISAGFDQVIRLWDVATNAQIGEMIGHKRFINSISCSPDGSMIASAAGSNVYLWDFQQLQVKNKFSLNDSVNQVTFSSEGELLIVCTDQNIQIFNVETVKCFLHLNYHKQPVKAVLIVNQNLISCCMGKRIVLQRDINLLKSNVVEKIVSQKQDQKQQAEQQNIPKKIVIQKCVPYQKYKNVICNWNTVTKENPLIIDTRNLILTIALSPDGKYIAIGLRDYAIEILNPESGRKVGSSLKGHTSQIYSIMYSKCGKFILSGSADKQIIQWSASTQKQIGKSLYHDDYVTGVEYSLDQSYVISCSTDKSIRIWDSETGNEFSEKRILYKSKLWCLSVSPISNEAVFGDNDGTIILWDYEKKKNEQLSGHTKSVNSIQYSTDGKLIVSGSEDNTIIIWNALTRQSIGLCAGHTSYVQSVRFSYDMRYIVSGGHDKTVRIWDRVTEKQIGESLLHHEDDIYATQFSIDGKFIISGGYDKQIRIMIAPIQ